MIFSYNEHDEPLIFTYKWLCLFYSPHPKTQIIQMFSLLLDEEGVARYIIKRFWPK